MGKKLSVVCVGDLILDVEEPGQYFTEGVREILKRGDITVGQVEIPHTDRGIWSNPEAASAAAGAPENLDILSEMGFDVATLAGNHIFDQGAYGVTDTCERLHEIGIATAGAGRDLEEARKPALVEREGVTFAFLNYNTVGPQVSWATPLKAGCAFIKVSTHYESDKAEPGGAPTNIYTIADPACLRMLEQDIANAKKNADHVICAFHMGRMFSTAILDYQREICHKAIDAGAEAVLCCHAHNLMGIERYHGKPIYYGLGHFVVVTQTAMPDSWIRPQHEFHPFCHPGTVPYWKLPVGDYLGHSQYYMFNEESRLTMIASFQCSKEGCTQAGLVPCKIIGDGTVWVCDREHGGDEIRKYLTLLNEENGLNTDLEWSEDGNFLLIREKIRRRKE